MNLEDYDRETRVRERQMREWRAEAAERKAAGLTLKRERHAEYSESGSLAAPAPVAPTPVTLATESVPAAPAPASAPDAATNLRYARLGFFAALALVLFLFWVRERRM